MNEAKISVIVPVYKVEPYLRRCLDSIVNQTYKNLEIILVDDGSPDNCGAICDEYASRDRRIVVIHKENGGLSSARNAGIDIATGEYIGFVDSDDWIEIDMYEYLYTKAKDYGADISICGHLEVHQNTKKLRAIKAEKVFDKEQALQRLLEDDIIQNFVWNKLWKRELFDGVIFPVGRTYEDVATTYRLFQRADSVICLPKAKYHYLQRGDSIMSNISLNNRINYYISAKERCDDMLNAWPQFRPLLLGQCVVATISIWSCWLKAPRKERLFYGDTVNEMAALSRKYGKFTLANAKLGIVGRIILQLTQYTTWWSFALAKCLGYIYKIKHGRTL